MPIISMVIPLMIQRVDNKKSGEDFSPPNFFV